MNEDNRRRAYQTFTQNYLEKEEFKASTMSKNMTCNYMGELLYLIKKIPDWQIYLNDKQINLVKMFVNYKSISDVARILNLPYGSVYSAMFGANIKDEQGIYGRLKKVYSNSCKHNKVEGTIGSAMVKRQLEIEKTKTDNVDRDYKQELFEFINSVPDWKHYLNEYQVQIVELYLEHKSCSKVDEIIGKNSTWSILYGKTKLNPKGVYKKLEKAYREQLNQPKDEIIW